MSLTEDAPSFDRFYLTQGLYKGEALSMTPSPVHLLTKGIRCCAQCTATSSTSAPVRPPPLASLLRCFVLTTSFPFLTDEFGLDWTPNSVTMWINSRVRIMFRYGFGGRTFWELGKPSSSSSSSPPLPPPSHHSLAFSQSLTFMCPAGKFGYSYGNGTIISNPWSGAEDQHIAPFDQEFYLRIALLAGGTDGYWEDNLPNKPWRNSDDRAQAMSRFWQYLPVWWPTWPSGDKIRNRGLEIESVKMYQMVPRGSACPAASK